jgi:PAS domain S-box-containing protein
LWVPGAFAGMATIVALSVLPAGTQVWSFLFIVTALVSLVVLLGAALSAPRSARLPWWSFFAFQALSLAAVGVFAWQSSIGSATFPGIADIVYLVAYLPAFVGLGVLIHRRYPGRDREAWIDTAILTVTAVCAVGLFLVLPILSAPTLDDAGVIVGVAYPLLDLALLSTLFWLLIGTGRPTGALVLLAFSFVLTLVADVTRNIAIIESVTAEPDLWIGTLRVAALVAMATAATTPSAETIAEAQPATQRGITTLRLAVLAIGVLAVPALVAVRVWGEASQTTLLLALAAIIVIILAVWRIQILVSAVQSQRRVTELVLDSAGDGIVGLDREGFVLFANLAARRMLRCREADLLGRRFHDLAHHEHPDGTPFPWLECPVHSVITLGEPTFLADQRYIRRDGTDFPVEIVMSPLIIDGVVTGAVQSFRDVSERQEVEEIKRQFVSVVSHELRTPLTSIKGSLQMLDSGITGPLTEDQQELVSMAVSNSERLGQLVNDILDLERLDAGRMPLEPTDVDATDLAHQAVASIHGAADAAGIRLETATPDDSADVRVHVDPHRMLQVLTNLLGNAIKFSERGSSIRVQITRHEHDVRIDVIDHGRGIPADYLSSVFERFGQVEGGDARRQGGTGLGLAIAREIVERSGGTISVRSAVGVGSTFTVTLPALTITSPAEGAPA